MLLCLCCIILGLFSQTLSGNCFRAGPKLSEGRGLPPIRSQYKLQQLLMIPESRLKILDFALVCCPLKPLEPEIAVA